MAKKKLTAKKAKEILHDKEVHGHPLTDKQRRFFGAIAGGATPLAQLGNTIYTSNPNDPRLKRYQDSLTNFKLVSEADKKFRETLDRSKNSQEYDREYNRLFDLYTRKGADFVKGMNVNNLQSISKTYPEGNKGTYTAGEPIKPKQPVVYRNLQTPSADTLFVTNPKDPRIRAYRDSLQRYTGSQFGDFRGGDWRDAEGYTWTSEYPQADNYKPRPKKPKQPVKYKKPVEQQQVTKAPEPQKQPAKQQQPPLPTTTPVQPVPSVPQQQLSLTPQPEPPAETKDDIFNFYGQGTPVYGPIAYGRGYSGKEPIAYGVAGFRDKSGNVTYIKPEHYQTMGVNKTLREWIEGQGKKKYGGAVRKAQDGLTVSKQPSYKDVIKERNKIVRNFLSGKPQEQQTFTDDPEKQAAYNLELEQNLAAGADWLKDWYTKRATLPQFEKVATKRAEVFSGEQPVIRVPQSAIGSDAAAVMALAPKHPVLFRGYSERPEASSPYVTQHELSHRGGAEAPQPFFGKAYKEYAENMKMPSKEELGIPDRYYNWIAQPTEQEAVLNWWRRENKIDPTKEITPEEVSKIMEYYDKIPDVSEETKDNYEGMSREQIQKAHGDSHIKALWRRFKKDPARFAKYNNQIVMGPSSFKSDKAKGGMNVIADNGKDIVMPFDGPYASAPDGYEGLGYSNEGYNYNPSWGGRWQSGGALPGMGGTIPRAEGGVYVSKSNIQGKGLFADKAYKAGEMIGLAHKKGQPTPVVGMYHNHSESPTAHSVKQGKDRYLFATRDLQPGEEITTNYYMQPELEQPEHFQQAKGGMGVIADDGKDIVMPQDGVVQRAQSPGYQGLGYSNKGYNYNSAWGGRWEAGGMLPGMGGTMYTRTGQDWKPRNISEAGSSTPRNEESLPVVSDAGDYDINGIWVPDWKQITKEAKKLNAKTVKTASGAIVYFDNSWNVKGVKERAKAMMDDDTFNSMEDVREFQSGGTLFNPYIGPKVPDLPGYEELLKASAEALNTKRALTPITYETPDTEEVVEEQVQEAPVVQEEQPAEQIEIPDKYKVRNLPSYGNLSKRRKVRDEVDAVLNSGSVYDNNATFHDLVSDVADEQGIDPRFLWSSSYVEGMPIAAFYPNQVSKAYLQEYNSNLDIQNYRVDGFRIYGLDNFGDVYPELVKKGYLPKDFDFKAYKAVNELGQDIRTAAFKNNKDAIRAKAAYLKYEGDRVKHYADSLDVKLNPNEFYFFTMAAYNGGLGAAKKMLREIKNEGIKSFDYIQRGSKGQVFNNVMPRYRMMYEVQDQFEAGGQIRTEQDMGQLKKLDQLTNFTNYNPHG